MPPILIRVVSLSCAVMWSLTSRTNLVKCLSAALIEAAKNYAIRFIELNTVTQDGRITSFLAVIRKNVAIDPINIGSDIPMVRKS